MVRHEHQHKYQNCREKRQDGSNISSEKILISMYRKMKADEYRCEVNQNMKDWIHVGDYYA